MRTSLCPSSSPLCALLLVACGCGPTGTDGASPPSLGDTQELDARVVSRVEEARARVLEAPGDAELWAILGMVFENERMRGRAVECYAEATRLEPEEPRFWFHKAGALGKLGRNEEAVEAIERSISLRDDYAPSHGRLGDYLFESGLLPEARRAYERATEADASYPGGWVGLARVQLQMDEVEPAIEILERVAAERPSDPLVRRVLAGAYRQAGRPDELDTEKEGEAVVELWPDPWGEEVLAQRDEPELRKVTTYLLEGKRMQALTILERLRDEAASTEDELAFLPQLAGLYFDLERLDDAERCWRRLLEIQPENARIHLNLADIHEKRGDIPAAARAVHLAIETNPNYAPAYRQAGRVYFKAGLFAEAAGAFEKAVAYDGSDSGLLYLLGMAYFQAKDWEPAERSFSTLLEREPDHADGWFAYARTCLKRKRFDEAEEALATARAKGFSDRAMIEQVTSSLQRARERAAKRAKGGGR